MPPITHSRSAAAAADPPPHTPLGGQDPPPHFPQFSADRMSNPFHRDSPVPVQSPCSQQHLDMLHAEVEDSERHMAAICSKVELLNERIANLVTGSDAHQSSASTPSAQGDGAPLIDIDIVPEFIGHTNSEPYVRSADPPHTPILHCATSASN